MKKYILIIVLLFTTVGCDKSKVEERQIKIQDQSIVIDYLIIGSWYSYTKNYYTELFIDSVEIYGLYEDIGIVPPIKYKIRNDSLIRYTSNDYSKKYHSNPRTEIVNDNTLRLLYNSDIDTTYLHRLPIQKFNIKDIMNDKDENEYMIGFRKRYNNIVKK